MSTNTEKATHTPGPWKSTHRTYNSGYERAYGIRDAAGRDVLTANQLTRAAVSIAEAEANARLIAAAPELLEVLRDILAFEESASVDEPEAERLIARANAAIAKATGETP